MEHNVICCLLAFLYFHCGSCYTVYIKPTEDASCGFSELTGDPCFTWTPGSIPTIVPPSTTFVFTPGDYSMSSTFSVPTGMTDFTITADPHARIVCPNQLRAAFMLNDVDNVSISNLHFDDCNRNQLSNIQSFLLKNCYFDYSQTQYRVIGITIEGTMARIVNSSFYGRVGHIRMQNSLSTLEVIGSNFTSGYSNNDGGSISSYNHLNTINIRDSRFFNNSAEGRDYYGFLITSRGGAIHTLGQLMVMNSLFDNNDASRGGAIYAEKNVTILNCQFTRNSGGGAVFSSSNVTATNSNFHSNWATSGGAIYGSNIVSTNNLFMNNTATSSDGGGGAIYTSRNIAAVNTTFSGNTATGGAGGAVYTEAVLPYAEFYIYGSSFTNNTAIGCGVLDVNKRRHFNVTLVESMFSFNKATGSANGGGVACFGNAVVKVSNCDFNSNDAISNAGVFTARNSSIVIEESSFLSNMAQGSGGVMYTNEYQTNYTIRHSTFHNNSAEDGGVMYVRSDSNVEIEDSTYTGNHATDTGGVFHIRGGTLMIDSNSTFSGNTANSGGVISVCFSEVTVHGLQMQPDSQFPQYCSIYDEGAVVTTNITPTILTKTTSSTTTSEQTVTSGLTTQPTTAYESNTHPEEITSDSRSITNTEVITTQSSVKTMTAIVPTTPDTTTTEATVQHTDATSEGAHDSTATTTPTTIATDVEVTTSSTSTSTATTHVDTTNVVEDSKTTETNGDTDIPKATTMKMTTNGTITMEATTTESPEHPLRTTSLPRADCAEAAELNQESDRMSVAYASLAISLVSLIVSVTVCVLMLLLFCKIWKIMNKKGINSLGERKTNFNESEYSFAVDDSPD